MSNRLEGKHRVGPYVLDLPTRSLSRNGAAVPLRRKVFDTLVFLAEHRDRVVTKDELIQAVWSGASISDDAIAGAVRGVRTALAFDDPVIQTVHGCGYRFVAPVELFVEETHEAPTPRRRIPWRPLAAALATAAAIAGFWIAARSGATLAVAAPPRLSEVAWLRFDEASDGPALDSSGNGNTARLVNTVRRVAGQLDRAVEFDGATGYLEGVSVGNGFPAGDAPRSVVCWVRTTDRSPGDRNLLHWGTPIADPPRLNFHLFLSQARVGWGNGFGQGILRSNSEIADGRWRQLAAVYTGPPAHTSYLYIDGRQVESGAQPPANTRLGANWTSGVFMGGGTPYRGALDDLRVFSAALTASTVQALYSCAQREAAFRAPLAGRTYFVPVGGAEMELGAKASADEDSTPVENHKEAFGAVQFAATDGHCACDSLRGAPLPPSFRVAMDIEFAPGGDGAIGPFLDSPPLGPGSRTAGLSGVWAALDSAGAVTVKSIGAEERVFAASSPTPGFDPRHPHHLIVERRGAAWKVIVDGREVLTTRIQPRDASTGGLAFRMSGRPLYNVAQRVRRLAIDRL